MRLWPLFRVVGIPIAAALGGCGGASSADKAGGSSAPVVLHLAAQVDPSQSPDAPLIEYFAKQARIISQGKLRIAITFSAAPATSAMPEQDIARMVRSGRFDLGFIGARAWDELGVDALRALQAPFLIDSLELMRQVAKSPVAARSLADLRPAGVVGIGLIPIELRHVFGRGQFVSVGDYAGARARDVPSRASDALFTALGAVPVHPRFADAFRLMAAGKIDLAEAGAATSATLNTFSYVVLFAKLNTLFANPHALDRLSKSARGALNEAAMRTVEHVVPGRAATEADLVRAWCGSPSGRVVVPTAVQLSGLRRAAAPVTAQLERDPETRRLIAEIGQLKSGIPPGPPVVVPAACSEPARAIQTAPPAQPSTARTSGLLDGTYRWVLTKDDARNAATHHEHVDEYPKVFTWTLRRGSWAAGQDGGGTYTINRDQLVFIWKTVGSVLRFSFRRDGDGTLHLRPVGAMDIGDKFVWTTEPWRRIGPPLQRALDQAQR